MFRYINAAIRVAVLAFITAIALSVFLLGEQSPFLSYPHWREACAADVGPCLQLSWQLVGESLLAVQGGLAFFWQNHARATMGGGLILVGLMPVVRHQPFVAGVTGAFVFLLLISGFYVLAGLDWQTTTSLIARVGVSIFAAVAVAALSIGSLMLFGMMLRGSSRNIVGTFAIRTAHSTPFPQPRKQNLTAQEVLKVGEIDGDTGSIRISESYNEGELKAFNLEKNMLVRLTWLDQQGRSMTGRPIYRRLRTIKGISIPFNWVPVEIKPGDKPDASNRELPLCILHFEDKAKLFRYQLQKESDRLKKELDLHDKDNRDLARLKIEKAEFWDWFHYVFNHTDPAVAWSFRMGLVVSLLLMIVQITFLEPILSNGGFVLK
ncbi:MAG: hypothetical protein RH982_09330 [Parvibaculum sp.]